MSSDGECAKAVVLLLLVEDDGKGFSGVVAGTRNLRVRFGHQRRSSLKLRLRYFSFSLNAVVLRLTRVAVKSSRFQISLESVSRCWKIGPLLYIPAVFSSAFFCAVLTMAIQHAKTYFFCSVSYELQGRLLFGCRPKFFWRKISTSPPPTSLVLLITADYLLKVVLFGSFCWFIKQSGLGNSAKPELSPPALTT